MKKSDYMSLEVGDIVTAGPLLEGMSAEPMMWEVYSITEGANGREVEFDICWYDLPVRALKTKWANGKVQAKVKS